MNTPLQFPRRTQLKDYILPALVALAGAGAAYAGADTTFDPALVKFTLHSFVHHTFRFDSRQCDEMDDDQI